MRWDTQDGNVTRHAEMFRGPFAGSALCRGDRAAAIPEAHVAIVELLTTLTGYRALPPGIRATADGRLLTRMLEVLVKRDGRWRIAACHNTAVAPTM